MTILWLPLTAAAVLTVAVLAVARALRSSPSALPELVGSLARKRERQRLESMTFRALEPTMTSLAAVNSAFDLPSFRAWIAAKLKRSGNPAGLRPDEFIAQCQIGALGGLFFGAYVSAMAGRPLVGLLILGAAAGFYAPVASLKQAAEERLREADKGLPYAVNLIVLGMEAGLDFSMAVKRYVELGDQRKDVMREELGQVLDEMESGKPLRDALLAMVDRLPTDALKSLVMAIVQAQQIGTPLAKVLREQVTVVQTRRTQLAEKLAGQSAVKILGPLMFIFAAVFLVLFNSIIIQAITGEIG